MTKEACLGYLERAAEALQDMREMLEESTPDAALGYLEAAQDVHDLVSRAVLEAMRSIIDGKTVQIRG